MKRFIAFILATLVISTNAYSQRAGIASGAGANSCSDYLTHRQVQEHQQLELAYVSWIMGFLTGYNMMSSLPQLNSIPEYSAVISYLDRFCRDNSLLTVSDATTCMIGDLGGYRPAKCKLN